MESSNTKIKLTTFEKDVFEGLTSYPKYLSSKYFYDEAGDALFQQIMHLPEYYLTNCEYSIIENNIKEITELFRDKQNGMDLIELGAGDGKKTKVLLHYMSENNFNFIFKPIDISPNAILKLSENLTVEIPNLEVNAEVGEYFEVLERLKTFNKRKKVILLLGSNIGNLAHDKAISFLSKLQDVLQKDDLVFIGFDQKKNPQQILNAYNDSQNVTSEFNKNILKRINKEMDADFNVENFMHWPTYDPETGTTKSFLVAKKAQKVKIQALDITIAVDQWESIHTEISQKYDEKTVHWLAKESGLKILSSFKDDNGYYKDYIMKKK